MIVASPSETYLPVIIATSPAHSLWKVSRPTTCQVREEKFHTIIEYLRALVASDERSTGRLGLTNIFNDRD